MTTRMVIVTLLLTWLAGDVHGATRASRLATRLHDGFTAVVGKHSKLAAGLAALVIACSSLSCDTGDSPLNSRHGGEYKELALGHTERYQTGDTVLFDHRGTHEVGAWHGVVQRVVWYEDRVPAANPSTGKVYVVFAHHAVEVANSTQGTLHLEDDWILGRQIDSSDMLGKHIDIDPLPHNITQHNEELHIVQRHALVVGHYRHVRPATIFLNGVATNVPRTSSDFYVVRVTHETLSDGTLIDLERSYFDFVFDDGSAVPRFADFIDDPKALSDGQRRFIEIN